jgi:glutathione S-transferase
MLELYHYGTAVCAAKARIVLSEKRLPWKGHIVILGLDGGKPQPGVLTQHDPAYLKLNPNGVVPTLVHDGRVIIESTVINEYLDDAFPEIPLRPADPYGRAQVRLWTKRLDEGLHAAAGILMNAIGYRHRYLSMAPADFENYLSEVRDAEKRETKRQVIQHGIEAPQVVGAVQKFQRLIADMEQRLGETPWLAGHAYTLADASFTPYMYRLETLQMAELWESGAPRVTEWYARIKERPSFHEGVIAPAVVSNLELLRSKGKEEWPKLRSKVMTPQRPPREATR